MVDLQVTDYESWDLLIGANGDLQLLNGDNELIQEVLFRCKTQIGDWTLSPHVGANLEQFIGAPNIPLTHSAIEVAVSDALTNDGLLGSPFIACTDIDTNSVIILIEFASVEDFTKRISVSAYLDLREGLIYARPVQSSP